MTGQGRDHLTGLADGAQALAVLARWQALYAPAAAPIHAMLVEIKRFAAVNLAYGARVGDCALARIGARLSGFAGRHCGPRWLAARLGGSTFLLAACEPCSRERWQALAEELALSIAEPIEDAAEEGALRLWPRLALLRAVAGEEPSRMLGRLGEALESGRHNPGRRFCWVDGALSLPGRSAQQLEADLLTAIEADEIELRFQPQFACADDRVVGAEALARWHHPLLGVIGPAALFEIAERADHVGPLSRHIAWRAVAATAQWPQPWRLSLNVTATDLATRDFADTIAEALLAGGLAPERLTLEITEQALIGEVDRSGRRLRQLVDLGVEIALDDFGAGFCNFHYLKALPLGALKLDRSMLDGVPERARDRAVLRGIISLAHALGLKVVAEGVETAAQRAAVAEEGCEAWQGFFGAAPMGAAQLAERTAAAAGALRA